MPTEPQDAAVAAETIAKGYAFTGPALDLGALLWDGTCHPDAQIRVPLAVLNRHGLVAGATGTGKTKTLQLIAEQLSAPSSPSSRPTTPERRSSRPSAASPPPPPA